MENLYSLDDINELDNPLNFFNELEDIEQKEREAEKENELSINYILSH